MIEARVKIYIGRGAVAIPHRITINDVEIPNVREARVTYDTLSARTLTLELYPTSLEEVGPDG